MSRNRFRAFTLSELLIALAILGVIAVFTIPKVLQSQQSTKSKSIMKETAGMVSTAYAMHIGKGLRSTSTSMKDLTPYINYLKMDTQSLIDSIEGFTSEDCSGGSGTWACVRLSNGATIFYDSTQFGATGTTNGIWFEADPDGVYSNATTGPSKSVWFILYYDGKLRTFGTGTTPTCGNLGCYNPNPAYDPPWFSWD
jgi:prepilin-type N-terminal cleavage/methylation domain-containing protein